MIKIDELVPLLILEWIKGDKTGQQEVIDNVDIKGDFAWINFKGGGRINGHMINEFMMLIGVAEQANVDKILQQKEEVANEVIEVIPTSPIVAEAAKVEPKNDIYFDILDKAKHDKKVTIDISLELDFVSKEKLQVLLDIYEEPLFDSLKSYIQSKVTQEVINKAIYDVLVKDFPEFTEKEELSLEMTPEIEEIPVESADISEE
jgi:hypothetical protein